MDNNQANKIIEKLDQVVKFLSLSVMESGSQTDQIAKLMKVGFTPTQIANIMDKKVNQVTAAMSKIRKADK